MFKLHENSVDICVSNTIKRKGTAKRREDSLSDNNIIMTQHDAKYMLCDTFVLCDTCACPECIPLQEAPRQLYFSKD